MVAKREMSSFRKTCAAMSLCAALLTCGALAVAVALPNHAEEEAVSVAADEAAGSEDALFAAQVGYDTSKLDIDTAEADASLALYRNEKTRPLVEWFYYRVAGSRAVSQAILAECDKNDIAPSLAFSLAYTESRYKVDAVNTNLNRSVDRGLFQLNSGTFTKLSEADFFDPAVNARHGLAHLRFCVGEAGNMVSALAMYNAGTNKVRTDSTPQTTLRYIGKIMGYKQNIERLFEDEVLSRYADYVDDDESGVQASGMVAMQ